MKHPWSPHEDAVIAEAVAGNISAEEMLSRLPSRPLKAIRRRFAMHGDADEYERHKRDCAVGSAALALRCRATGSAFR